MAKNILLTSFFCLCCLFATAQEYNIGVRAGQNWSTITGPQETGEEIGYSGGFHFGINFSYNFTDFFSLRTEILYMQNGYDQKYVGDSHFLIWKNDGGIVIEPGSIDKNLQISNAYLQLPITGHVRINKKWEVFGGVYGGILIGPTGRGTITFESTDNPEDIFFKQSLDHKYYSDKVGQFAVSSFGSRPPIILVEGQDVAIPKVADAYYQYISKNGNLYNTFDAGISAGVTYYFNRGFYLSTKVDYGLLDITNDRMDRSLADINSDKSFVLRKDSDKNFGIQASFGFKF